MKCKYCPYKFTKTQYKYSSIHILHICSTEPLSVTFIKKCKTEILTWELEGKLSEKKWDRTFYFQHQMFAHFLSEFEICTIKCTIDLQNTKMLS